MGICGGSWDGDASVLYKTPFFSNHPAMATTRWLGGMARRSGMEVMGRPWRQGDVVGHEHLAVHNRFPSFKFEVSM